MLFRSGGEWIEVIPANVTKIMEAVEANKVATATGYTVDYDAKIQPPGGFVEFEEAFTATFELSADKLAAMAVEALIAALPTPVTLANKADVVAARAAYELLTAKGKGFVGNLATLEAAEAVIAELDSRAEFDRLAKLVKEIKEIGRASCRERV